MPIITFSQARGSLAEILNEVAYKGKRIIVTRRNKKLVAIVPLDDLKILERKNNSRNQ